MSWSDFAAEVQGRMTPELATHLRLLRAEGDASWRGIADEVFNHPSSQALSEWADMKGDQALGMYLCEAAAKILGEDPNKEPWN